MTAVSTDHIPAAWVHAGDELIFTVRSRCSGTTACSALDALSASNFIIITVIADDPDAAAITFVAASESVVTRAAANSAIGRAA